MSSSFHRPYFLITLAVFLLSIVSQFSQAQMSCGQVFHSPTLSETDHIDEVMHLFFFSSKGRTGKVSSLTEPNEYFEEIWSHPLFRDYLTKNHLFPESEVTMDVKYRLISKYVEAYLSRYRDAYFLKSKEEHEAKRGLLRHGANIKPGETALQARQRISSENLKRIIGELFPQGTNFHLSEVNTLVDNFELFLAHNSHIMKKSPSLPIISPFEIDSMGLDGFGMSTWTFNRFLGSDRFVYFKALFKRISSAESPRSEYGDHGVIVKKEYAKDHALISPFVMYEPQLYKSVAKIGPQVAESYLLQISEMQEGKRVFISKYGEVSGPREARAAQSLLHKLDFTPEDFEFLVKVILKQSLHDIYEHQPLHYKAVFQQLSEGNLEEVNFLVNSLLTQYLKYDNPEGFEGVIPVAIPENHLKHF